MTTGSGDRPYRQHRRRWAICLALGICLAGTLCIWSVHSGKSEVTSASRATYAFDVTDPRLLAGFADDVFLGRVAEKSASGYFWCSNPEAASPYSLYRVKVLKSLKGNLSGTVELTQMGGIARDGNLDLFEGDRPLKPGELCLFVTKGRFDAEAKATELEPTAGRPTIVNTYGDQRIDNAAEKVAVLAKLAAAIRNQVTPSQIPATPPGKKEERGNELQSSER